MASSQPPTEASLERSKADAREAGLVYTTDERPGLSRRRQRNDFVFVDEHGKAVRDAETIKRIRALVIPPAWENVWICKTANGHLQATGQDARGRKQYRYHKKWREQRDETKFEHMAHFARSLPRIRRQVMRDLRRPGMPREKILATVVRLLETTLIRVGNDEYARTNHSYGLTTMRNRHVHVKPGGGIVFSFRGKSGKDHEISLTDPSLAKIIRKCQHMPGQELFTYEEDGQARHIASHDVNDYLHAIAGREFTAKDFRTWIGTVLAATAFRELEAVTSERQAKKNVSVVVESVSKILGNTPSVCRKCYIHPEIIDSYMEGTTVDTIKQRIAKDLEHPGHSLRPMEIAVLALLQRRLQTRNRGMSQWKIPKGRRKSLPKVAAKNGAAPRAKGN
jgi:DNA topoisomerase-1